MRYDRMIPMSESPDRVDIILGALNESGFFNLQKPVGFGLDEVLRIHDPDFVKFLKDCYTLWEKQFGSTTAFLSVPIRRVPQG